MNMVNLGWQLLEWYRYLNCGYRLAVVGGTDKMSAAMPVGAIRTYALLDTSQAFSFEAWTAAVRAGRTFATTGPLLDLRVEGRYPGENVCVPAGGGTLHVHVQAESVVPFDTLEVVVNGEVAAVRRADEPCYACALEQSVRVSGSAWIAARCLSRLGGWVGSPRLVAAHTSPVYVLADGQELCSPADIAYMLTLVEGGITWLDTLASSASAERHARARRVFEEAHANLQRRLQRHAHPRVRHAH